MKIDNTRRRRKACAIPITPYFFKIGVSLLDFGAIRFKSNSITNVFSYNGGMLLDFDSFNDVSSYKSLVETLSMLLYEDDRQSFRSDNYFLGLPSALSVQFDARLNDNIYVNASWIQPVRFFHPFGDEKPSDSVSTSLRVTFHRLCAAHLPFRLSQNTRRAFRSILLCLYRHTQFIESYRIR